VSKGKRVTIVSGAIGSRSKAEATLKQLLGVGGEICEDDHTAIELQGDQTKRIPIILKNIGGLISDPTKSVPSQPIKVERTNYQYDKFMKKPDTGRSVVFENTLPVSDACILVHGKYWPYCNGHCQYCPPLTDVFEGLEMYCSWFDSGVAQKDKDSREMNEMTTAEILAGLSLLGMRAEVGEAVRLYEKDKKLLAARSAVKVAGYIATERVVSRPQPVPVVRRRQPPVIPKPNLPVRVIMNHLHDEDDEWFVLRISMRDRSLWISDYEEFIHSMISASEVVVAAQIELVDSRTMKARFWSREDRDACKKLLEESMEGMLEFEVTDAVIVHVQPEEEEEEELDDGMGDNLTATSSFEFQRMAEELGLESNDEFWEIFCNLIDISDGTTDGVVRAFNEAVLRVLEGQENDEDE
jgi:hypothetical protein